MAGNKKNNLKNNATGGKKPKINVNVAQRNRLINNLKNKGLSKNVINRFIKNYNTGTKGVNQILQEVKTKANAKREQNAKNAAALRQLKKLRPELF
jgi:DNA-binding transcriptional MerR regulator